MQISLLHATYHRASSPTEIETAWKEMARWPNQVEHVYALDDDDINGIRSTAGRKRVINASMIEVSAVRNWNAAAAIASGDILLAVADDLYPDSEWDSKLQAVVRDLDPLVVAFAVKVGDSKTPDTLMRHPIVSRAFYDKFGLFDPRFRGVYCDDDITNRAYWHAAIIDGRSIRLEHRHPTVDPREPMTISQRRINAPEEYVNGRHVFEQIWSKRQRRAPKRLVSTVKEDGLDSRHLARQQYLNRAYSTAAYQARAVRARSRNALRSVGTWSSTR